jgi:23S rRNA (guanosine2251-2'-O)-methyltransferase
MKRGRRRPGHAQWDVSFPKRSEDDLLKLVESLEDPFLLVLDEVQDPHNLGACLRSADAAGCDGVIAPKHLAASITSTVRHIVSGAAENIPFYQATNLARTLDHLRDRFITIVGTGDVGSRSHYEVDLTPFFCELRFYSKKHFPFGRGNHPRRSGLWFDVSPRVTHS